MHIKTLYLWKHNHDFAVDHKKGEKRVKLVLVITALTMFVEIIAGIFFGSMALLADGWHMGTHVAAFMITAFTYRYARKNKKNPQFTFGTGKVSVLGGFASAIALLAVALVMSVESVQRIFNPQVIFYNESIGVAIFGMLINVICAFLLKDHHSHSHSHEHDHHSHDHNLKAAYFHVLADAFTSLTAIAALFSGKYFGWNWIDPVMGIVGALVITRWSSGLLKETSTILLDKNNEQEKISLIKTRLEAESDTRISDLHLWKLGPEDYAGIISVVTHFPKSVEHYKELIKDIDHLSHITVEVNRCDSTPCIEPDIFVN